MAKMLLIEDNPMNCELAKFLIENAGHQCIAVPDGLQGIERAQSEHFDVILLDIQLPKIDGYGVLKELRQKLAAAVPIIAVSSYAMVGDSSRAMTAGFDGYISKPIKAERFVKEVLELAHLE